MSSTVDITIKWQNISSFHHHRELNIFFKTVQFGEAELLIINIFWNNIEEEKYSKLSRFLHLGVIEQSNCVCYLFIKLFFPFLHHLWSREIESSSFNDKCIMKSWPFYLSEKHLYLFITSKIHLCARVCVLKAHLKKKFFFIKTGKCSTKINTEESFEMGGTSIADTRLVTTK